MAEAALAIGSVITAVGEAAPVIGTTAAIVGAGGQFYNTQQAVAASRRAERLRLEAFRAETLRKRREAIRQAQIANSLTAARATNQGVGLESTAVAGGYSQTQGELGRNVSSLAENQRIGEGIFQANLDYATYTGNAQSFNQLGNLGATLLRLGPDITKVGQSFPGLFTSRPITSQVSWTAGTTITPYQYAPSGHVYDPVYGGL